MNLFRKLKGKIQVPVSRICNRIYERFVRKRIKNDRFTILASNCIGGLIYHRLGKQFLSPTINLWMSQPDFLKFVLNLHDYIEKELVFISSKYTYPVANLGDIKLFFAHYTSEHEAELSWNRRKQRINYDNLYIIMYDRDGISKKDILKLDQVTCKNKVVLSDKNYPDIDYVLTMNPTKNPNGQQYVDADWFGIKTFEKQFDYVAWLNLDKE